MAHMNLSQAEIELLMWKGIEATQHLAASSNSKVIVIGNGGRDLPVILGGARD